MRLKIAVVITIVTLLGVVIGQNIILNISLRNVYTGLSSQEAKTLFEVKDLRAAVGQELTETRRAAEMTRADNASQEAYTQKQLKTLSDYVTRQRQLEIKQTKAMSETLAVIDGRFADFGGQLQAFDDQLYRLKTQATEQRRAVADGEGKFYEGGYMFCLWLVENQATIKDGQETCLKVIKELREDKKLHEQAAPGWAWPILASGETAG